MGHICCVLVHWVVDGSNHSASMDMDNQGRGQTFGLGDPSTVVLAGRVVGQLIGYFAAEDTM